MMGAQHPDCIYCEQPVTDGSEQDYDGWLKAEPAHRDCINDAAERQASEAAESEPPLSADERYQMAAREKRELRR